MATTVKPNYLLVSFLNNYIQDVLVSEKAGAHLVIVTRGGQDTLSLTDEKRIKEFIQYYQVCPNFSLSMYIYIYIYISIGLSLSLSPTHTYHTKRITA